MISNSDDIEINTALWLSVSHCKWSSSDEVMITSVSCVTDSYNVVLISMFTFTNAFSLIFF